MSAVLLLATLAGCDDQKWDPSTPTVLETPEIVWESGPPAGEFEEDEFVIAARAAELGIVLAQNNHDYTITQLTDYVSFELITQLYENDLHVLDVGLSQPEIDPGPVPLLAFAVTETTDGADVEFCAAGRDWTISDDHPDAQVDIDARTVLTYRMARGSAGIVLTGIGTAIRDCDATGVAVGYFTPTPTIPEKLTKSDVRAPLGYED